MFTDGLLRGRRILITGGGTGLGKGMAEKFLALGAEIFIGGRRKSVCEATAAELMDKYGGSVTSYALDIRDAAAVDAMVADIFAAGAAHRPHQQRRRQFHLPHRRLKSARLRRHRQHRHARHVLCHPCRRPPLDRRRTPRQRGVDRGNVDRQRQPLCGALGHEQIGGARHDHVARHRMGPLRHPAQRYRAGRNPDRGCRQATQSRAATPGERTERAQPDGTGRARWRNCKTSRRS